MYDQVVTEQNLGAALMVPPIVCEHGDDLAAVEALSEFRLKVRFHDGLEGVIDLQRMIHASDAGVFASLANPTQFAKVGIEWGAVWWPGDIGMAPDTMHSEIKARGVWAP